MRSIYMGGAGGGLEEVAASIHLGWPHAAISTVPQGQQPGDAVRSCAPDLIVVRLSSQRERSLSLLQELREAFCGVIVTVSKNDSEAFVIEALDAGADDYFTLPLNKAIFVARVRAALRRMGGGSHEARGDCRFGELIVDSERHEASVQGRWLRLTRTEFRVLEDIVARGDLIVSKEALCEDVWGPHSAYEDAALRKHIQNIRRKLRDAGGCGVSIETVPGVGYRLVNRNEQ